MIIKLEKIISCSSEHPSYPASNLLQYRSNSTWRCAKPGEMLATVIFQLAEPSCITGMDIANYRSCVVIVTASTSKEPDNWVPIVNHQFMTNDEAANGKFKDQVQIFTKKDLNPDTVKIKFDRAKFTCMQSANLKELFGLSYIVLKTEVIVDLGLDVFGRFKMKESQNDNEKSGIDNFKDKYLKMLGNKKTDYRDELRTKVNESAMNSFSKRQEEHREPMKRPLLEKLEAGKSDEVFGTKNKDSDNSVASSGTKKENDVNTNGSSSNPVVRTPFGDVVPSPSAKTDKAVAKRENQRQSASSFKRLLNSAGTSSNDDSNKRRQVCSDCPTDSEDRLCKKCNLLSKPKPLSTPGRNREAKNATPQKPKKLFGKLFEDIAFSLSGYINPKRDEIRRKAIEMGATYVAGPNATNKRCTHLICAFKNTPKYQQLKGHCKIVSHTFIEECYNEKKRLPWRRFALDHREKAEPESEEEILGSSSPPRPPNPFEEDTDSD